ncbi:adhesion G-protein coupled receptor G4 [Spea bombifrons]|uniref:adhesion G-protein coupled receptor G4 n=1 Tax=Spea bombifrons TaxID=233779 RepID=UPI00234934BA|nr:adhesion G-protein coupled receptor G4 [Spea bombifrons]
MKDSVRCRYPRNLLLTLILTFNIVVISGTDSFSRQTVKILTAKDYVQLINAAVPALKDFTICVDIRPDTSPRFWTVFSYREADPSNSIVLGLVGSAKALKMYHLGNTYEFDCELPLSSWHSVCSTWNSLTRKLEVYVNGSCVFTIASGNFKQMKGNGTLVLGINHSVQGGEIINADVYNFIGNIYNFQLWDSRRPSDSLSDCSNGNIVNWTREIWKFNEDRLIEDTSLRCAKAEDMLTTAGSTTARTSLGSSTTGIPTTRAPEKSTTSQIVKSESTPNTSIFSTKPGMSSTHNSASSLTSSTSEPNSSEAHTTLALPEQSTNNTTSLELDTTSVQPSDQTPEPTSSEHNTTTVPLPVPTAEATSSDVSTAPLPGSTSNTASSIASTQRLSDITTNESSKNTPSSKSPFSTGSSTTGIPTTRAPEESTTSQIVKSESIPNTSVFSTKPGMSSTHNSASSLTSSTSEPNSSETHTTLALPGQSTNNTTSLELYTTSVWPSDQTPEPTSSEHNTTTVPLPVPTAEATSSDVSTAPLPGSTSNTASSIASTQDLATTQRLSDNTTNESSQNTPLSKSPFPTDKSSATSTGPPGNLPSTSGVSTNISNGTTSIWTYYTTEPQVGSTTKTSTMDTSTAASTVTFYMLLMDISVLSPNGILDLEQVANITKNLMDVILEDTEFLVVQFNVEDELSNEPWKSQSQKSNRKRRETNGDAVDFNVESKAIIRAISPDPPESLAIKLEKLLESQDYSDAEATLNLSVVYVQIIVPGTCPPETTYSSEKGVYKWVEKNPTETARVQCSKNSKTQATRYCNVNITTEKAEWEKPNLDRCPSFDPLPNSIQDLQSIPVTPANAVYMAIHIWNITSNSGAISKEDTKIILSKVYNIVEMGETDLSVARTTLDIIDSILLKAVGLREFTNRILNVTEEIGYQMDFSGLEANMTAQTLALSVTKVNFSEFQEIFFTVTSYVDGMNPEITMEKVPADEAVAFIHLPGSVQDHTSTSTATVQFNFFGKRSIFEEYDESNLVLNTYVVSASVSNTRIQGLKDPVDITLRHVFQNKEKLPVHCVFWDFHTNNGHGGWNATGCRVTFTNANYTTCHCSHLTHFGVLLDISRSGINAVDGHILSILSYVACGIASLFLGIALVTYCVFKQLRRDYPSKILMNLSSALFLLNLLFLLNTWLSSFRSYGLCIASAALLHYFLLAAFTWMGLEAVHMYFAFVKVFNLYIHNYILKFCIAGWGIPAIIVAIVLVIDLDFYGGGSDYTHYAVSQDNSDLFCWIQDDIVFYVTVVAYFCAMFLVNICMFIVVLVQINSLKFKKKKDWRSLFLHDVKSAISIAFLLGITWGFAFFAWGPVRIAFLYLFSIFNTLQGFFIFVFHCLIKENVRRQWRMHLCCGKFRLDNYSDWSRLSNAEAKQNGCTHTSPSDSFQSTRSNTTVSTSNASSLSSFTRDEFTGRSFVNGGIFISSAQLAPPNRATIHPDARGILSFLDLDLQ